MWRIGRCGIAVAFLCGVFGGIGPGRGHLLPAMPFLEKAAGLVSTPSSPFYGITDQRLLVLHHAFHEHVNMLETGDGFPTSLTMRRAAESAFKAHYGVSAAQYSCLVDLYHSGEVGSVAEAYEESLPYPPPGDGPDFVRRYFTVPIKHCCGAALVPRPVKATFYDRDACYAVVNYAMWCRHGCGATYHLNKKVIPATTSSHDVKIHEFYPWSSGEQPEVITNKSGKSILSTRLLTDVALHFSRHRVGFGAVAEIYNNTVRHDRGQGTPPLSPDTLLECWSILSVLKVVQRAVPWHWFPPPGQEVTVEAPQTTRVTDVVGEQSGANHWVGLRTLMEQLLPGFWAKVPWARHYCDLCRRSVEVHGEVREVQVAALDGVCNTRHRKCAVYECTMDLPALGGTRFCTPHESMYGHQCAFSSPPCNNPHLPGRLACDAHQHLEDRWRYYNQMGSYRLRQRLRREGHAHEPNDMPFLRAQFSAHYTHGQLIGSWNCGIISGMATLWEHEGMEMVSTALEEIFPWHDFRPSILFYDNAYKLRRWRNNNPVLSWAGTRHIVDRFHFRGHREFDCSEFCSPEARDDPYLWDVDPATGAETFRWNSSMAESNNAWLHGFGDIVKQMPRVLGQFFLNEAALVRNEITLKEKLLRFHPSFAA